MFITLTTDFGTGSSYVAAMKGVILSIDPVAQIVDLGHEIPPQDVRQGAIFLAQSTHWFPPGTVHVVVVDPGVGTSRPLLYARIEDQQYLLPDNGLLSLLLKRHRAAQIVQLEEREHWLPEVSSTFHGRDILAPVAAQLSLGLAPEKLGRRTTSIVELAWPEPTVAASSIRGEVISVDRYGNLITNITRSHLPATAGLDKLRAHCNGRSADYFVRTYGEHPPATPVALVGSSGYVELAVVNQSAAQHFAAAAGAQITLDW